MGFVRVDEKQVARCREIAAVQDRLAAEADHYYKQVDPLRTRLRELFASPGCAHTYPDGRSSLVGGEPLEQICVFCDL